MNANLLKDMRTVSLAYLGASVAQEFSSMPGSSELYLVRLREAISQIGLPDETPLTYDEVEDVFLVNEGSIRLIPVGLEIADGRLRLHELEYREPHFAAGSDLLAAMAVLTHPVQAAVFDEAWMPHNDLLDPDEPDTECYFNELDENDTYGFHLPRN